MGSCRHLPVEIFVKWFLSLIACGNKLCWQICPSVISFSFIHSFIQYGDYVAACQNCSTRCFSLPIYLSDAFDSNAPSASNRTKTLNVKRVWCASADWTFSLLALVQEVILALAHFLVI